LEEHVTSIFRAEYKDNQEASVKADGKQKFRLTFKGLHGVISQKIEAFSFF
jgi:hypothetical protein